MKEKEIPKESPAKNTAPMIPSAFPDEIPFTRTDAPMDINSHEVLHHDSSGTE